MKLVRYGSANRERPAIIDRQGAIRSVGHLIDDLGGTELAAQLTVLSTVDVECLPKVEGHPRIGPCVGRVGKIVGVGLNYRAHAIELKMDVPQEPIIFLKATSAIAGPFDQLVLQKHARQCDWEVELAIVVGRKGKNITRDNALDHVSGYCILNDVSERSFQFSGNGQWSKGKSMDGFAPIGPWFVTRDEIADIQHLDVALLIDGELKQTGNTSDMIFDVRTLISYISRYMTLHAGDVIATGTPAGVGFTRSPPQFLRPGNVITSRISGLGEQEIMVASVGARSTARKDGNGR